MGTVKKHVVVLFLLILPFLIVSNRVQAMENVLDLIREHAVDTLVKGGVGAVVGAVGGAGVGYLLGSTGENDAQNLSDALEIVKLKKSVERYKDLAKTYKENLIFVRRWQLGVLKTLNLPLDTKPTQIPKKISFALKLYNKVKSELRCDHREQLEKFSPETILMLYTYEVGGLKVLNKLLVTINKKKIAREHDLMMPVIEADKEKLLRFVLDSVQMQASLKKFLGKEIVLDQLEIDFKKMSQRKMQKRSADLESLKQDYVQLRKQFNQIKLDEQGSGELRKQLDQMAAENEKIKKYIGAFLNTEIISSEQLQQELDGLTVKKKKRGGWGKGRGRKSKPRKNVKKKN